MESGCRLQSVDDGDIAAFDDVVDRESDAEPLAQSASDDSEAVESGRMTEEPLASIESMREETAAE